MSTAQAQKTPGPRVGVGRRTTCVVKETLKVFAQHPRSETERMETFRICGTKDSDTLCLFDEFPQHRMQDAAVAIVFHFDRRIDTRTASVAVSLGFLSVRET